MAAHLLGAAGFATETAWDGRHVIALALILQPAVIDMSTKLAYVTGCQATRILKKDIATRAIRILIYTGHGSDPHLAWAEACGCDALLRKPSPRGKLASEVARLVAMGSTPPALLPSAA